MINIKVLHLVKWKSAVIPANNLVEAMEGCAFMDYESEKCGRVQRGSICGSWKALPCMKIFKINNDSNNNESNNSI